MSESEEVKLYAKVIVPRTELPPMAAIYSDKIGEVVDAPTEKRETGDSVWLKFSNGKIGQFYYKEIRLLTDEDPPEDNILIPIGEYDGTDLESVSVDEDYIAWIEVENPEQNCEVI